MIEKEIGKIYDEEKKKLDLDEYTKKLVQTKKKLNTIQATIISVQVSKNFIKKTILSLYFREKVLAGPRKTLI